MHAVLNNESKAKTIERLKKNNSIYMYMCINVGVIRKSILLHETILNKCFYNTFLLDCGNSGNRLHVLLN